MHADQTRCRGIRLCSSVPYLWLIRYLRLSAFICSFIICFPAAAQLRLHPDNPRYLEFRGKPTLLITSGEHYGAVLNGEFDYVRYLDELKDKKLNLTRTFSGTYFEVPGSFSITDNTLAPANGKYVSPWVRTADGKYDLSRFNPDYFTRLKDFLKQASDRGIVVEYVLFCPFYEENLFIASPIHPKNNINGITNTRRNEAYTLNHPDLLTLQLAFVARAVEELKDFDNFYYEICNEPYFGGVTLDWQAKIAQAIVDAEKDFPQDKRHLIAQNIANGSKKVAKPIEHVSIYNFHYAVPPDAVAANAHLNRPIGDDETGFKGSADVTYRSEGWDFILAGGAIYSSLDYSFSVKHPAGTFTGYKSPGGGSADLRRQLGHLKAFMESFDFVKMKPMNELITGGNVTAPLSPGKPPFARASIRVLGESGKQYAAYIQGGTSAELELKLPDGAYRAEWIDTLTGETTKAEDLKGGPQKLTSPRYKDDIALRIKCQ